MRTGGISINAFFASHVRIPFSGRNLVAEILVKEIVEEWRKHRFEPGGNLLETSPMVIVGANTQKKY